MDDLQRDVLTVTEVASYLRVSVTTVWRWCSNGKLPAFRIGRGWRVRRSDLEHAILGHAPRSGTLLRERAAPATDDPTPLSG